ncbi:MAG: nitrate- and nitrite sensing domain-containing protein, partial [Pseudomonadota bacterium]
MKLRLVMIIIILPLLALSGYFAKAIVDIDRNVAEQAHAAHIQSQKQQLVNDLIHELQKERGYSAGFLSSDGQNFIGEIVQQRQLTNARIEPALVDIDDILTTHPTQLADARAALTQIGDMRQEVDGLGVTVREMASFYTTLIENLIQVSYPSHSVEVEADMESLQMTRALLAAAKEDAGIERAMGATGLGSGFSPQVLDRYSQMRGAQYALIHETTKRLNDPAWETMVYQSSEYQAIEAAREKISVGLETGDFQGLTPQQWFQIATNWIEFLHQEEIASAEKIEAVATALQVAADNVLWEAIIIGGLSVLLAGVVAIGSFETMIYRIKRLTDVVDGFANGEFDKWVPGIKRKDEISSMASAIYHFKQETLALRR